MAPVGLGNLVVGGETVIREPSIETTGPTKITYVIPIHLVVVGPSNITLIDEEVVTPYTVQINFDKRGEYIIQATNRGEESVPIPVALNFPRDGDVVNRETDKFFVGTILTISGIVFFCLNLSTSLFVKRKHS
jgi:hypothetical protein